MTILAIFCSLWGALDIDSGSPKPRWMPVRVGNAPALILVSQSTRHGGQLNIADTKLLLKAKQKRSEYDYIDENEDTLQGPLTLTRKADGRWQIPNGSLVKRKRDWFEDYQKEPPTPPLTVSGDLLCHWEPALYTRLVVGEPARWDSVCFDVSGHVRRARLVGRWAEIHPWLNLRTERDSGQRLDVSAFIKEPDRIVLQPAKPAKTPPKHARYWHGNQDFFWLDDSGKPLTHDVAIPWNTKQSPPCIQAHAGSLMMGIRPHFDPRSSHVCWAVMPGSTDTLRGDSDGINLDRTIAKPGWHVLPELHRVADGWSLAPDSISFVKIPGMETMEYFEDPIKLRWLHGNRSWRPVVYHPIERRILLDSTPPRQNRNTVWSIEPSPFTSTPFHIKGFGIARWTGDFRWRSDDSLVAWAGLSCTGAARDVFGKDTLYIELPVHWNPKSPTTEFIPDTISGFRTLPRMRLDWRDGWVGAGEGRFLFELNQTGMRLILLTEQSDTTDENEDQRQWRIRNDSSDLVWMRKNEFTQRIVDREIGLNFEIKPGPRGKTPHWTRIKDYYVPPLW